MLTVEQGFKFYGVKVTSYEIKEDTLVVCGTYNNIEKVRLTFRGFIEGEMLDVLLGHYIEYIEFAYDDEKGKKQYNIKCQRLYELVRIWADSYEGKYLAYE